MRGERKVKRNKFFIISISAVPPVRLYGEKTNMLRVNSAELIELIYRTILTIARTSGIIIKEEERFAVDVAQEVILELTNRMGNTDQRRVAYNSVTTQTEVNLDGPNVRVIPAGAEGPRRGDVVPYLNGVIFDGVFLS